jgi:hypothetical protein
MAREEVTAMQKSWTRSRGFNTAAYGKGGSGKVPQLARRGTATSRVPNRPEEPAGRVFQSTPPWRRKK